MSEIVFQPQNSTDLTYFIIGLLAGIGGMLGAWLLLRKSRKTQQSLIAMLLFFVGLIGLGTALFSYMSYRLVDEVVVTDTHFRSGYGETALADIKVMKIVTDRQSSFVNPSITQKSTRVLLIEEKSGRIHSLSELHYDITAIMRELRARE